jgi:hypothetical protein
VRGGGKGGGAKVPLRDERAIAPTFDCWRDPRTGTHGVESPLGRGASVLRVFSPDVARHHASSIKNLTQAATMSVDAKRAVFETLWGWGT